MIYTFNIHPSTHVRTTRGESWIMKSTEEYLKKLDDKRVSEGKFGAFVKRRKQLEKYSDYKQEVAWLAQKIGYIQPRKDFAIVFYIPMPVSWRKKKIAEMEGKSHENMPDFDNLLKSFFDGIMPRKNRRAGQGGDDDRKVSRGYFDKVWCKQGEEKIVIYTELDYFNYLESVLLKYKNDYILNLK